MYCYGVMSVLMLLLQCVDNDAISMSSHERCYS